MALDRAPGADRGLGRRARFDAHRGLVTHQRAGQRLDQEVLGVGVVELVYGGAPAGAAANLWQTRSTGPAAWVRAEPFRR